MSRAKRRFPWATWSTERLLQLRVKDLGLTIEGTWLEPRIDSLYETLERRGFRLRPHIWLSEEWFSPQGVPGFAIPFYLAHPRLIRLERSQMLDVEGGTRDEFTRIMRHETGHAIQHGYQLQRRHEWQRLFGKSSKRYPDYYRPNPTSKRYVQHLRLWYAQSHPDEDFAETFAAWLTPEADWKTRYADWPALKKLEYMDELMKELAGHPPRRVSRRKLAPLPSIKKTLRQHYDRKRAHYGYEYPNFYDRDLRRMFAEAADAPKGSPPATRFLGKIRKDVCRRVSRWTGEYRYTIDRVFEDMIRRCRELNLRLTKPEDEARLEFTILLTVQTMNYLHSGRHRVAL
jgi:hypothetical protein